MEKIGRKLPGFLTPALLGFIVLLALSACSFPNSQRQTESDWEDEVLWAQECGLEDMVCCLDKEPSCESGLSCCYSAIDAGHSMCSSDCSCGKIGKFCCAEGFLCEEGAACVDNVCQECGDAEEACCADSVCNGSLTCYEGKCLECGQSGNPCCQEAPTCSNEGDIQNQERNECREGICHKCGTADERACLANPFCSPGNLFNNDVCLSCGKQNEPCCSGTDASSSPTCFGEGLRCLAGFCIE